MDVYYETGDTTSPVHSGNLTSHGYVPDDDPAFNDTADGSANATRSAFGGLERYAIFWAAFYINKYYLWVIFTFGFPGNVVSLITILRMKPFSSPTVYVAAVAVVDNTCLFCKLLFLTLTRYDVHLTDGGCATLIFLGSFTSQLANWLLVIMTVERCLAICLPLKVGSICTRSRQAVGLAVIVVVLLGVTVVMVPITKMQVDATGSVTCNPEASGEFMRAYQWVDAMFYAILPAALLLTMNILIIIGIKKSSKIQRELTSRTSQEMDSVKQQRQITIMLVIVCMAFVLLITPNALFFGLGHYWTYCRFSFGHAGYIFTEQLCYLLSDSTHAVNFYFYFLSTGRFRNRCLKIFGHFCWGKTRVRKLGRTNVAGQPQTPRWRKIPDGTTASASTVQSSNMSLSSSSSYSDSRRRY